MSYLNEVKLATQNLEDKIIDYQDWAEIVLGPDYRDIYGSEYLRRACKVFSIFLKNTEGQEAENDKVGELRELLNQIKDERIKLSTINIKHNAIQRAEARNDLFKEELIQAIGRLEPIKFSRKFEPKIVNEQTGVLCIGDEHYGTTINMESLFGEKVNVYNPQVFKTRMERLMNSIEDDTYSIGSLGKLIIFDLGDSIQGIIHMSDLMKLKAGIVDCSIEYAEYISQWLVELSERLRIPIEYIAVGGNHSQIRSLNTKKGDLPEDNVAKIITQIVQLRLANNPNITIAPYAECGFKTVQGVNILAYHGDDTKDVNREISFFEDYHQIDNDIL